MIANKHTEVRLMSNLNDLLEDSKKRQDLNKKIHKHTFEYIMTYVSDNDIEDKSIYDKLEELATHYQTHCYKLAKEIKDEILKENGEELEIIREGFDGYDRNSFRCQKVEKEIFLDPKIFSQDFKDNLQEELSDLIIDNYWKELDNVSKIYEYRKKIENAKDKNAKYNTEKNKDLIHSLVRKRIESSYRYCFNRSYGDTRLVLFNFETVYEVREELFKEVVKYVKEQLGEDINSSIIRNIYEKTLNSFIKEKRAVLGLNKKESRQETDTLGKIIPNPKLAQFVLITKMWKDITK